MSHKHQTQASHSIYFSQDTKNPENAWHLWGYFKICWPSKYKKSVQKWSVKTYEINSSLTGDHVHL